MIYASYAIKSKQRNYIYVGITKDIHRRFGEHCNGYNKTTKPYLPFEIIYYRQFGDRVLAREDEKYLKSGSGKEWLKTLL